MAYNQYIKTGYRINFNSYGKLFRSLFMLHNETVNIWTHIVGGVVFMYLVSHTFVHYEPSDFYYQILLHNKNRASNFLDLGIPYEKFHQMKNDYSDQISLSNLFGYIDDENDGYCEKRLFYESIQGDSCSSSDQT